MLPFFALALVSCTNLGEAGKPAQAEIKPGLILVTPEVAAQHGLAPTGAASSAPKIVTTRDASTVMSAPQLHAYSIGRYVDPADPNLMHEAHLVYRKEAEAGWRLAAAPGDQVLVGPRLTERSPESGTLQNKELAQLLLDLRRMNDENREAITMIYKLVDALVKKAATPSEGPETKVPTSKVPTLEKGKKPLAAR